MTRRGTFSAMNRAGMNDCPSPYLQMSFETTCTFLTKAAIEGAHDTIQVEIYLKFLEIDGS
jgi:DNA-directed RNA polymerase I subunit RPA1